MTDEQTRQAIIGFTEMFKAITGNQDLKIPNEIAEKYGIEEQTERKERNMKLIIDIPEEKYKTIQDGMYCGMLDADLYRDIKNGTPLDDLKKEIDNESVMHMDGEIYVRNIDVKRILGKTETR